MTDALAIADSLMADPPIVIDYRMIVYKMWQRPSNYAIEKEIRRWVCYGIHVGFMLESISLRSSGPCGRNGLCKSELYQ
jgi:hypothetical protein